MLRGEVQYQPYFKGSKQSTQSLVLTCDGGPAVDAKSALWVTLSGRTSTLLKIDAHRYTDKMRFTHCILHWFDSPFGTDCPSLSSLHAALCSHRFLAVPYRRIAAPIFDVKSAAEAVRPSSCKYGMFLHGTFRRPAFAESQGEDKQPILAIYSLGNTVNDMPPKSETKGQPSR